MKNGATMSNERLMGPFTNERGWVEKYNTTPDGKVIKLQTTEEQKREKIYRQILNREKSFTKEDMRKAFEAGLLPGNTKGFDEWIKQYVK